MTTSNKTHWLLTAAVLLAAGLLGACCCEDDGEAPKARVTPPFSLTSPVQSSMEAPVDIEIESSGNGSARVTLVFHRPGEDVTVRAYGTEGVQVFHEGPQLEGLRVQPGHVESFDSGFAPNEHGGGLFAVHVTGLFDGQLQLARAASVRVAPEPLPEPGRAAHAADPGEKVVTDSEGRRVHVMPAGE